MIARSLLFLVFAAGLGAGVGIGLWAAPAITTGEPSGKRINGTYSPYHFAARGPELVWKVHPKGQASPAAVLEKYRRSLHAGDLDKCMDCMRGTSAALCYRAALTQYRAFRLALRRAIFARFGARGRLQFQRLLYPGHLRSLRKIRLVPNDNEIRKLDFVLKGGLAHCTLPGDAGGRLIYLSEYKGAWYIDANRSLWQYRNRDFVAAAVWCASGAIGASRATIGLASGKMNVRQAALCYRRIVPW